MYAIINMNIYNRFIYLIYMDKILEHNINILLPT